MSDRVHRLTLREVCEGDPEWVLECVDHDPDLCDGRSWWDEMGAEMFTTYPPHPPLPDPLRFPLTVAFADALTVEERIHCTRGGGVVDWSTRLHYWDDDGPVLICVPEDTP